MKHHTKEQVVEEQVHFCLYFLVTVHHCSGQELNQSRNLEAGTDAEALEECFLLAYWLCSSWQNLGGRQMWDPHNTVIIATINAVTHEFHVKEESCPVVRQNVITPS